MGGPRRARRATGWQALFWLGPSLALIGGVVLYPAAQLVRASLSQFSVTGLAQGFVGLRNYTRLFRQEPLAMVVANTVVWVAVVVAVTIFLSLALAQLLAARFPGRTLVRWALTCLGLALALGGRPWVFPQGGRLWLADPEGVGSPRSDTGRRGSSRGRPGYRSRSPGPA